MNYGFSCYFFLIIEEADSGSVPRTYWIRVQMAQKHKDPAPDPQQNG
jgi:hypothetical protein